MAGALFWTTFKDGDSFNPVNAFTTLAIVGLIGLPLGHIMAGFPRLAGTVACFQRVQSYLRLQEKQEKRKILRDSPSKGLAPLALTEKDGDVLMPTETSKSVHSQEDVCPIEFVEASIGPSPDKVSVIHDASFRIARSKLTVVVGPTASGKSTLLKAMIGEAHIARGTVQLEHDYIAYCGQNAWLMNKSVRENILGNSELDGEWYKTVLHVCCLQEDIQRLSKGDETLAGSGGLQLSGGQRQRIVSL
jgi:ABC-type multidrug transport system fused ATPase/permease subunit